MVEYVIPINNRLHDANEIQQRNKTNSWTIHKHPHVQPTKEGSLLKEMVKATLYHIDLVDRKFTRFTKT